MNHWPIEAMISKGIFNGCYVSLQAKRELPPDLSQRQLPLPVKDYGADQRPFITWPYYTDTLWSCTRAPIHSL